MCLRRRISFQVILPVLPAHPASAQRGVGLSSGRSTVVRSKSKAIQLTQSIEEKICARGQAGLQDLYNPDRLRNAIKQSGGRGSRKFEALYWEDAIALLIQKLAGIDPVRVSFLGGKMPDHLYFLSSRWLEAMGAPPLVRFNLQSTFDGRITASKAAQSLFGSRQLPIYDIANAEVIFSFGANFLDTWQSPVAYSQQFGEFRHGQAGGRVFLSNLSHGFHRPLLRLTNGCRCDRVQMVWWRWHWDVLSSKRA